MTNLTQVCEAYLRTVNAWDTRIDTHPDDAGVRAAKYTAGVLRSGLLSPQPGGGAGDFLAAQAAGKGYSTVSNLYAIEGDSTPAGEQGSCGYEVTTSVLAGDGKKKAARDLDVITTLSAHRQPSGAWLITNEESD
ncbi:hypothetical protein [Luteipulveratus halotolerans]|nr:hypothetical protein [Luteipulveratus halotolerans]